MRLHPDGFLGAVVASESLGMTDTMINGAGGCRSRSQIMIHDLIPSYTPENRGCCKSKYFSRQSRLPCTYLNNDDIVFGSAVKVSEGIESVSGVTGRRTLLIDTLGASLICTEYSGLTGVEGRDPVLMEGDLSGMTFAEGYDVAMALLLESMDIGGCEPREKSVNLLGYGIQDPGWETGAEELRHLMSLMGVEVVSIPGCLPSEDDVRSMGSASLNVMVRPELCRRTAAMLGDRFGTPFLRPSEGAPIGYPSTRSFVREVASALGADPEPALEYIDRDAERVHRVLMNYDRAPIGLHAKGLVVDGDSSSVYPILKWMTSAFGTSPRRIDATDTEYSEEIGMLLDSMGYADALTGIDGEVEVVFCDGMTALEGRLANTVTSYIEIRIPRGRQMDLMGRCLVGTRGARYILDELFNGITRFRCGQPTEVDYRPGCCD